MYIDIINYVWGKKGFYSRFFRKLVNTKPAALI